MNYTQALDRLDKGVKKDSKKIANNTWLVRHDKYIGVKLHDTEVVEIYPYYYKLFTGGWYTVTTKSRINEYSPAIVSQTGGRWYVRGQNIPDSSLFYEGMKVDIYGHPLHIRKLSVTEDKKIKKLKFKIAKYVKLCGETIADGLPLPSGGDCWYCAMKTRDGESLGDSTKDNGHLLNHLKEGYIVPSLLLSAVKEAGYAHPEYILHINFKENKPVSMGGSGASIWGVTNSVRKYLNKRLLPVGVIGKSDNHSTGYNRY